jgi:hypothetical protein
MLPKKWTIDKETAANKNTVTDYLIIMTYEKWLKRFTADAKWHKL